MICCTEAQRHQSQSPYVEDLYIINAASLTVVQYKILRWIGTKLGYPTKRIKFILIDHHL